MRGRTTALAAILTTLSSGEARAVEGGELSVELGQLHNADPTFDLFSENNGMPSCGWRGGARGAERLAVTGGWHRVRRGADRQILSAPG